MNVEFLKKFFLAIESSSWSFLSWKVARKKGMRMHNKGICTVSATHLSVHPTSISYQQLGF